MKVDIAWTALGLLALLLLGLTVKPLVANVRKSIKIPSISDNPGVEAAWIKLCTHPDPSGYVVGYCERLAFFVAFYFQQWEIIGFWVGFKVASKWEAWNNMAKVPDHIEGIDELRFAVARRIWAAQGYATLVVGTSLNAFIAGVCVLIPFYGPDLLLAICTRQ